MQGTIDPRGGGQSQDALHRHMERRIRRSSRMFGREATIRYVARLAEIAGEPVSADFQRMAEDALGMEPGSLRALIDDHGPS